MALGYRVVVKCADGSVLTQLTHAYVRKQYAESIKERWEGDNPKLLGTHSVAFLCNNILEEAIEEVRKKESNDKNT